MAWMVVLCLLSLCSIFLFNISTAYLFNIICCRQQVPRRHRWNEHQATKTVSVQLIHPCNLEQPSSVSALVKVITSYIDAINTKRVQNWSDPNCEGFARLEPLIEQLFCITASSAPVERVFSHGGLFMRPHRTRLGDKTPRDCHASMQ